MKQSYLKVFGKYALGIFMIIASACSNNVDKSSASQEGTMQEVMTLNNEPNDADETPLISAVSLVTTDEADNIYVVDPRTMKLHAYRSDLSHRWSAGDKGRGPGLFNTISAIHASGQTLYVYDLSSAMMTRYSLDGKRLGESNFGESGHQLNHIRRMTDGSFIAAGRNEKSGTMVNIYSDDFESRTAQFLNGEEILDTESPNLEKQVLRNFAGSVIPVDNSTILYAAPAYDGTLLVYRQQNKPGKWEQTEIIKGYRTIKEPLTFHRSQDGNNERSHLSGFHPDGGYFSTEFTSMSRGLYKLENGVIAHLSLRLNENDEWDLVLEHFNLENLSLQDHTIVKGALPSQQFEEIPVWMDKKGQIYITQRSEIPLKVVKIEESSENDL